MPPSRIGQSSSPSNVDAPETPTTTAPRPTTTPSAASPARGPSVTVDSTPRSSAQQRLAQINARTAGAPPGAPLASHNVGAGYGAAVQQHTAELLAGRTPHAPEAPPLPHMSGHDVFNAIGGRVPDMSAGVRGAIRDVENHHARSLVELALNTTLGRVFDHSGADRDSTARAVDFGGHVGLEVTALGAELLLSEEAAAAATTATSGAGLMVGADAVQMTGQEVYRGVRGQQIPSHAVIETMRQEQPQRTAAARARLEQAAGNAFDTGARQAAMGQSFDATRSGDRAYVMGYHAGQQYRTEHGPALEVHDMQVRAIAQARSDVARMTPSHAPAPDRATYLQAGQSNTVGAHILTVDEMLAQ